jgi:hypothetical protein
MAPGKCYTSDIMRQLLFVHEILLSHPDTDHLGLLRSSRPSLLKLSELIQLGERCSSLIGSEWYPACLTPRRPDHVLS